VRALVVDDSRAIRVLLGRMLREMGFEIHEAGHGAEALERLKELGSVEVALVDWNMPEMDGYQFIQAVRSESMWNDVRVMMVTTECGMDEVLDALNAGADDYIMKPFDREIIREKLLLMGLRAA